MQELLMSDKYEFILGARIIEGRIVKKILEAENNILLIQKIKPSFLPRIRNARAVFLENTNQAGHSLILIKQIEVPCVLCKKESTLKAGDFVKIDFLNKKVIKTNKAYD